MPELPWAKWFPSDWASDPLLSMCDIATQGVWMNAVNAMLLLNAPRITGALHELCIVCRCRPEQLRAALAELKAKGVGSITEHNECTTIECRRLVREHNSKDLKRKAANARWCKSDAEAMQTTPLNDNAKGDAPSASASAYASNGIGIQGKGVRLYPREIKMQMEAKERQALELKAIHCCEVATGDQWDNQEAKKRYRAIRSEIKALNNQLANYQ